MRKNKLKYLVVFLLSGLISFCFAFNKRVEKGKQPFIIVLGTAQDGGYPHAGCKKQCCAKYYEGKEKRHYVSCVALVDPVTNQRWFFDCTPDFTFQLHALDSIYPVAGNGISGIFLTHAHIGHYTGLMYLGREAMNTKNIPVYAMPRMRDFLRNNGPWSQLVNIHNIEIHNLEKDSTIQLNERISVTPFRVPHRDEYSETVGFRISTKNMNVIFIPDIDKWEKWDRDIVKTVQQNDLIFIDGTFFKDGELSGVKMSEVPHPFMEETMKLLSNLSDKDKQKVHFIHMNHTNPALIGDSAAVNEIESNRFHVAKELEEFQL
ncbi:MAG TPA: MBL fold metallo-hydrolase [Bacteroidia bacterium]|nr:MBL fold metallo-hydrolase [Bacteroidia bacterium]